MNNFVNRLRFDRIMAMSLWHRFVARPVHLKFRRVCVCVCVCVLGAPMSRCENGRTDVNVVVSIRMPD